MAIKEHVELQETLPGEYQVVIGCYDEHGFQGRVLADLKTPRFLNSVDKEIFDKWIAAATKFTAESFPKDHVCESVTTPDGNGSYCRECGETLA